MPSDTYFIVVIDDARIPTFSTDEAINLSLLTDLAGATEALKFYHSKSTSIDELWLDHDLGMNMDENDIVRFDDIMPLVKWLEEMGYNGTPLNVGTIFVHTANPGGADQMMAALNPYYDVVRAELPVRKQ